MKTLQISVNNKVQDRKVVDIYFPFDPRKAIKGFYSGFLRAFIPELASSSKIPKEHLKLAITILKKDTKRIMAIFPSGTKVDLPEDLTIKDCEIIQHHLKGIKMAIN